MSTTRKPAPASANGRRTVILAGLALVGASGLLGGLFHLQGQAARGNYAVAQQVVPDMAPALQEARLAKAKVLREKWQKWALEHKSILQKMLRGGQSEQEAVWQALPTLLDDPKVTSVMLEDISGGLTPYTWNPVTRGATRPGAGLTDAQRTTFNGLIKTHLADDLELYHDIKISSSRNAGAKTIGLWVSGRITETETVGTPYEPGKPSSKEVTRELVPPYDFLQD